MEDGLLKLMDLGGTVAVVAIFLWYMRDRNGKHVTALEDVGKTMTDMNASLNRNTKVLIKVAQKHGYMSEADTLIEE